MPKPAPSPAPDAPHLLPWEALVHRGHLPVLLIRHGQTAWNAQRRFLGASDVPLDEVGHAQAARLARFLAPIPFQAAYSSPLSRAHATAQAVCAGRPLPGLHVVPELKELSQGVLEGHEGHVLPEQHGEFMAAWAANPTHARVPGGETLGECRDRAVGAMDHIVRAHAPGAPVAVFTHKMVISTIVCEVLELPLRMYRLVGQLNTAVNLFSWDGSRLHLHRLNEAGHLDDAP